MSTFVRAAGSSAVARPTSRPSERVRRRCASLERLEPRRLLASFPVTNLNDAGAGSLRDAITSANGIAGDDVIPIEVNGVISLASALPDLSSNIDVQGPGPELLTVRDSTGFLRIFTIAAGTVTLSGMTVADGSSSGIRNAGTLTISNCVVRGNRATTFGTSGGAGVYNSGTLTATGSTIRDNTAFGSGGGIRNVGGDVSLSDCAFINNVAQSGALARGNGGGIANSGTLSVITCTFDNNTAGTAGGGVFNGGTFAVSGSAFTLNTANYGGGVHSDPGAPGTVSHCTLNENGAGTGGGIAVVGIGGAGSNPMNRTRGGTSEIEGSGYLTVTHCTLNGNSGGGIYNGEVLAVLSSTLSNNSGGGIVNDLGILLTVGNCTFRGNSGRGIYNFGGDASVFNSTFSDSGNGLYNDFFFEDFFPGTMTVANSTLAGSAASFAVNITGCSLTVNNSIVSSIAGAHLGSHNLIGGAPLLAPLADNGGPTWTHALLPGSPAIDAGSNALAVDGQGNPLVTDQRGPGFARIVGGTVDVGAYEVAAQVPVTVTESSFHYATAPHRLSFTFSGDVAAAIGTDDLLVQNLTTGQTVPQSAFDLAYNVATRVATFTYTGNGGGFGGVLADGNYRATLLASGMPLATDHVFNFRFLNGDANNDGRVNLQDFNVLAANFGQSPRDFTQGDFNYDSVVNLQDFNILAGRFGIVLTPALAPGFSERGGSVGEARIRVDDLPLDLLQ